MAQASSARPRWPLVAGVVIVVCYNSWLFAFVNPHPAPLSGYLSELAAAGQPYHWLFRSGDVVAGVLFVAVAVLGKHRWARRFGRAAPWLALAVATAGLGTIADTIAHMPCAPTLDAGCRLLYPQAPSGPGFTLHTLTSTVVSLGFLASFVLAAWGSGRPRRYLALGGIAAVLSLGSWVVETTAGTGEGYVQAIQVLLVSLWIGRLSLLLGDETPAAESVAVHRRAEDTVPCSKEDRDR
ncbi:putative membrane protein [Brevibacterium epidermidis]|uniref:Membrane protein n=1 Tax=Brevibacterium epidermidis TaxID=1698 RepID=A0ABV4EKB5_BREEP